MRGESAAGAPLVGRGVLDRRRTGPSWPPGGGVFVLPSRRVLIGLLLAASALAAARIGGPGGAPALGARPVAVASFDGVGYGLLGVSVTGRIAQRGGRALQASGTFAIVKLKLRSVDGRPHAGSTDLLALEAGGVGFGVSSPDDIGLTDRQWGAAWGAIRVPAGGSLTVKAVFDVPVGALRHPVTLRIGGLGYAGRAPAQILALTGALDVAPVPPRHQGEMVGPLAPDPVLGLTPAGGDPGAGPESPPPGAPGFADSIRFG